MTLYVLLRSDEHEGWGKMYNLAFDSFTEAEEKCVLLNQQEDYGSIWEIEEIKFNPKQS